MADSFVAGSSNGELVLDRETLQVEQKAPNGEYEIDEILATISKQIAKQNETLNEVMPGFTTSHERIMEMLNQLKTTLEPKSSTSPRQPASVNSQTYSLIDIQTQYDNKIETLEKKLLEKISENKLLHKIMQSGQTMTSLPDEQVAQSFTLLYHKIEQFCRNHNFIKFRRAQEMKGSDKILFWQSEVAFYLAKDIFNRETFGNNEIVDRNLQAVEQELLNSKVPSDHVALWKAHTSKTIVPLIPLDRTEQVHHCVKTRFRKLLDDRVREGEPRYQDLHDLYDSAYTLALTLRKSGIAFQWSMGTQNIRVEEFVKMPGYIEPGENGYPVECRILFGPVVKVTDQGRVVIREGTLLTRDAR